MHIQNLPEIKILLITFVVSLLLLSNNAIALEPLDSVAVVVYAGAAGALLVHYISFASTDQFPFMDSVWYLGMLIVGGMGSTVGAIFGVVALKLLDEVVTAIGPLLSAAIAPQAAASVAIMSHGLIIIIFLIFEPRGLHHRWEMIKNYFRLWPFSHQD